MSGVVALITGASRGIGECIAMEFAKAGVHVVLNYNRHALMAKKVAEKIKETAISYSICMVSEETIDKINILEATKLCMKNAIEKLDVKPDIVLVDAISKLDTDVKVRGIVKGDALSYSIGAASILAKVERDKFMCELAKEYPEYGFEKNKGYGTKEHIEALKQIGPCVCHRLSFLKFLEK